MPTVNEELKKKTFSLGQSILALNKVSITRVQIEKLYQTVLFRISKSESIAIKKSNLIAGSTIPLIRLHSVIRLAICDSPFTWQRKFPIFCLPIRRSAWPAGGYDTLSMTP